MSEAAPRQPQRLPPPILVEDAEGLGQCLAELEDHTVIAVDTEADSFFHYKEKVCLIQVSAGETDWLLDPLAGYDMAALGPVLADPARTKVFHDGEYDVLILKRDFGFTFASLFDTRIAVAALGSSTPGLASVLAEHFDIRLDKSLQRSDWSRRPLTQKQIDYARLDTRYLIPLMERLVPELERARRLPVVVGEGRRIASLEPPPRPFQPDEFIRLKGARALSRIEMRHLRELFCLRDEMASGRDVPPFKVMSNQLMLEVARSRPRSMAELLEVAGFSSKLVRRLGGPILDACRKARELGPLASAPRLPSRDGTGELDEFQTELHERVKLWRKEQSERDGMDSSLVLNRKTMLALATEQPSGRAQLEQVEGMQDWQVERYADAILDCIAGFQSDLKAGRIVTRRSRRR